MEIDRLSRRLRGLSRRVATARSLPVFMANGERICKLGRELNFLVAREFDPDYRMRAKLADELTAAASAIEEGLIRFSHDLDDAQKSLVKVFASNTTARAKEIIGYGRPVDVRIHAGESVLSGPFKNSGPASALY